MSAILPPAERLWYKHPIDRVEGTWIAIALAWCLTMFFMMVGWHIYGKQNLATETYKTAPEKYSAQAQAVVDKYTVRTETEQNIPVVAPPEGSDVYMVARLWNWWPILELQKGKTAIDVGSADKLVTVLETVIAAVKNGELDVQIEAASSKLRDGFKK